VSFRSLNPGAPFVTNPINKEDSGSYARCLPEGRKCALGANLQKLPILSYAVLIEESTSIKFACVTNTIVTGTRISLANL
jgi:hypothetical protein